VPAGVLEVTRRRVSLRSRMPRHTESVELKPTTKTELPGVNPPRSKAVSASRLDAGPDECELSNRECGLRSILDAGVPSIRHDLFAQDKRAGGRCSISRPPMA